MRYGMTLRIPGIFDNVRSADTAAARTSWHRIAALPPTSATLGAPRAPYFRNSPLTFRKSAFLLTLQVEGTIPEDLEGTYLQVRGYPPTHTCHPAAFLESCRCLPAVAASAAAAAAACARSLFDNYPLDGIGMRTRQGCLWCRAHHNSVAAWALALTHRWTQPAKRRWALG